MRKYQQFGKKSRQAVLLNLVVGYYTALIKVKNSWQVGYSLSCLSCEFWITTFCTQNEKDVTEHARNEHDVTVEFDNS